MKEYLRWPSQIDDRTEHAARLAVTLFDRRESHPISRNLKEEHMAIRKANAEHEPRSVAT